ncbi:hypothetical protein [Sphingobacterium faecium]
MINQDELFKLILVHFKNVTAMDDCIAGMMQVTTGMAARWRKGLTLITYDRLQLLIQVFKIRTHLLFTVPDGAVSIPAEFQYIKLDVETPDHYLYYIKTIADQLEAMTADPHASLWLKADEIPAFHLLPYRNLIYFMLFAYVRDRMNCDVQFEDFVVQIKTLDLDPVLDRIKNAYDRIPSIEVWHDGVFDNLLYQIENAEILEHFKQSTTKMQLLSELDDVQIKCQEEISVQQKSSGAKFECYRKEIPIRMGYGLAKQEKCGQVNIKIDSINSMFTENQTIFSEFSKSFKATLNKAIPLGIGPIRDRTLFFRKLKDEIAHTRNKLN